MFCRRIDVNLPLESVNVHDLRLVIAQVESNSRKAARAACDELIAELRDAYGDIRISKAHSEDWVAVATVEDAAIGVDIEIDRPRPGLQRISDFVELGANSSGEFWQRWTLREAIAKSVGGSVLIKEGIETGLSAAAIRTGHWAHARQAAALCGQLEERIYYSLVLNDLQSSEQILCA